MDAASTPRLSSLAEEYRMPLLRFFQRRLRAASDAEDLVQDVFVRLARHEDLASVDHLHGYIFQIAANVLRDRVRRGTVRAEPALPDDYQPVDEAGFSPERVLLGKESAERLISALYELPEKCRMVFSQYHFDGVAQVEIARRLNLSLSTVEKQMQRANAHLLRRMRDLK
jgi:RNA polymerase sigma-70 factor (ECF subfamily)